VVIERYAYYNLDFLKTEVRELSSRKAIDDLFNSHDEANIRNRPGGRWDLAPVVSSRAGRNLSWISFCNMQILEM